MLSLCEIINAAALSTVTAVPTGHVWRMPVGSDSSELRSLTTVSHASPSVSISSSSARRTASLNDDPTASGVSPSSSAITSPSRTTATLVRPGRSEKRESASSIDRVAGEIAKKRSPASAPSGARAIAACASPLAKTRRNGEPSPSTERNAPS